MKNTPKKFEPGDTVSWSSPAGTVTGTVKRRLTESAQIKGHHVAASDANPEYLVESSKTGAQAAHKPESLRKK